MTKLKRQRARKKFNYSTNRRRVRDKREKNSKFNVKVRQDVNCLNERGGGVLLCFVKLYRFHCNVVNIKH